MQHEPEVFFIWGSVEKRLETGVGQVLLMRAQAEVDFASSSSQERLLVYGVACSLFKITARYNPQCLYPSHSVPPPVEVWRAAPP